MHICVCGHDRAGALLIMNMLPLTLRDACGCRGERVVGGKARQNQPKNQKYQMNQNEYR